MAFHFPRRLAAVAAAAALALPVLAQQPPAAPATATAGAEGRAAETPGERRDFQERKERRQAHRAERMAAFKAQLQLAPAQEPAWTAYTAALQGGERHARLNPQDFAQLTTPERIDRMRALRAQRAAEADRRGEATKTFYAALTPAQQKTFDAKAQHQHRGGQHCAGERHHGKGGDRHQRHGGAGKAAPAAAPAQ